LKIAKAGRGAFERVEKEAKGPLGESGGGGEIKVFDETTKSRRVVPLTQREERRGRVRTEEGRPGEKKKDRPSYH